MSSDPASTSRRRLKEILKDCSETSSQGVERIQKLRTHQAALNDEIAMLKMYTAMLEARTAIMMDIMNVWSIPNAKSREVAAVSSS